jgi:uncharacterized protein (TIGR02996 family)
MSDDERALLRTVIAAPDDDTPRLVYADWLEEHGRPERAELIRVQCWLAQAKGKDGYNDQRGLWHKRQRELLRDYSACWRKELPRIEGVRWGPLERGMVECITIQRPPFARWGGDAAWLDAVFEHAPLRILTVSIHEPETVRLLLQWSGFMRFQEFRLINPFWLGGSAEAIQLLIDHLWQQTPKRLSFENCMFGSDQIEQFATATTTRTFPLIDCRRCDWPRSSELLKSRLGDRVLI